jgi:hypothetical protein
MRNKIIYIVLVLAFKLNAQVNLVMNPSFETQTLCPSNTGGDVDKAIGWDTCRGTADYFHSCGTNVFSQVPKYEFGYQVPFNGIAYTGLLTFNQSFNSEREIIIGQLVSPMTVGQKYYITFKVSRADHINMGYSTNKIGVKFTKVKQSYVQINNVAHYYSNNVITDTLNWTKISGNFISDSIYQYIMLGNFFDDINTTKINDGIGSYAYYYIDDVCLSTDSIFCASLNEVGIQEIKNSVENLIFYPNPANEKITVRTSGEFRIYSPMGYSILLESAESKNEIDTSKLPSGLYFIKYKNKTHKFIINH